MNRAVAIIPARLESSRLPNKALADIYAGIGIKIGAQLSLRPQDYVRKFNESIS